MNGRRDKVFHYAGSLQEGSRTRAFVGQSSAGSSFVRMADNKREGQKHYEIHFAGTRQSILLHRCDARR